MGGNDSGRKWEAKKSREAPPKRKCSMLILRVKRWQVQKEGDVLIELANGGRSDPDRMVCHVLALGDQVAGRLFSGSCPVLAALLSVSYIGEDTLHSATSTLCILISRGLGRCCGAGSGKTQRGHPAASALDKIRSGWAGFLICSTIAVRRRVGGE